MFRNPKMIVNLSKLILIFSFLCIQFSTSSQKEHDISITFTEQMYQGFLVLMTTITNIRSVEPTLHNTRSSPWRRRLKRLARRAQRCVIGDFTQPIILHSSNALHVRARCYDHFLVDHVVRQLVVAKRVYERRRV